MAAFEIVDPAISESEKLFIVKSHLNSDFSPIASASRSGSVRELVTVCKDFEVSRSYRGRPTTAARSLGPRAEPAVFQRATINRMDNPNRAPLNRQQFGTAQMNTIELNQGFEEYLDAVEIIEREALQQDMAYRNEMLSNTVEEVNTIRAQTHWRGRSSDNALEAPVRESTNRDLVIAIVCWQCENPGHTYPRCPNPKRFLFCYSCGKKAAPRILRWRQLDTQNGSQVPGNRTWENSQ